jgi:hypothetical protein
VLALCGEQERHHGDHASGRNRNPRKGIDMTEPVTKKPSLADEVRAKIEAVAAAATPEDRRKVTEITTTAKKGEKASTVVTFTPAMSAILFLHQNPHNRDWRPAASLELARRMGKGEWSWNNATLGFYVTGDAADGQHRLAAAALAAFSWTVAVVFGIRTDAIITVDVPTKRTAADAAKLEGVADAARKEVLIKSRAAYLTKAGDQAAALRSPTEVLDEIKINADLLDHALEVGRTSSENIVTPVLKETQAAEVAYLMLKGGWPLQRIREKLSLFQSGQSRSHDAEPFFVTGVLIQKARDAAKKKDQLNRLGELGAVMYAMVQTERGVNAIRSNAVKDAVKKTLPAPNYPEDAAAVEIAVAA